VPIVPGDTADSLSARILAEEHALYAKALAMVARGETVLPARHHSN
jgi:phosphoribosylglycinamide formyltransferase-1